MGEFKSQKVPRGAGDSFPVLLAFFLHGYILLFIPLIQDIKQHLQVSKDKDAIVSFVIIVGGKRIL